MTRWKKKMKNMIRACGVLVCQYVVIFCCNISLTDICKLTIQLQINLQYLYMYKAITNFTKIWNKGRYILYCIVFFLIFSVSLVWQSETGIFLKCKIRICYPTFPSIILFFFYVKQLQDAAQGVYNIFFLDRYEPVS